MIDQVNINSNTKGLYDISMVNTMCRGNQELVVKLMNVFLIQVSKSVDELALASQENNTEKIRYEIHKVKPTLAYYGTSEIERALLNFESLVFGDSTAQEIETSIDVLNKITQHTVAKMKMDFGIANN